jgi:hypothetical protein
MLSLCSRVRISLIGLTCGGACRLGGRQLIFSGCYLFFLFV